MSEILSLQREIEMARMSLRDELESNQELRKRFDRMASEGHRIVRNAYEELSYLGIDAFTCNIATVTYDQEEIATTSTAALYAMVVYKIIEELIEYGINAEADIMLTLPREIRFMIKVKLV